MELLKIPQAECGRAAITHIKNGLRNIGYILIESPIAIVYKKTQVEEEMCKELGYEVYESFNNGGTILGNSGDIMFSHLDIPGNRWIMDFIASFTQWLISKGLNAEYTDNDILVDGYKVCGVCITRYGEVDFSSGFIGVNTNLEHIKKICKKPMNKVPKGLSEFGITTEEIENWFVDFCNKTRAN